MMWDWKHFALTHALYLVLIAAAAVGFYSWRGEHDARIKAEATITASQAQIATLQQSIDARDKASAAQIAPIIKVIRETQTTPQVAANLPQVVTTPLPLPTVAQPDGSLLLPQADVLPIFNQVADDKVCRASLTTAQADLTDTKAIVTQQVTEIKALKAKPSFWHRAGRTIKWIAVGAVAVVVLSHGV